MENAFKNMIEKLLDRNKNAKQKASRISKRSAEDSEVSKHTPLGFETYSYMFRNIALWK